MTYAEARGWPYGRRKCETVGCLSAQGLTSGIVAGIFYIFFEMFATWAIKGVLFEPLRMISGILLTRNALADWYNLFAAATMGFIILIFLSGVFGLIFGVIVARRPDWAETPNNLIVSASIYGLFLWIFNYYVIAPVLGWSWFTFQTDPFIQGFIGHTLFFGTTLGVIMKKMQIVPD